LRANPRIPVKENEDLPEIQEILSPKEERFQHWRSAIGLFLGPLAGLGLYLLPMPGLSRKAHILAAIIGWVVTWWITEPIPIPATALFGTVLCVLLGVAGAKEAFASFADPTIFLFLGSFILARAMSVHGLDKRFAYKIMSLRWVGNSAGRLLLAYGAISAFLSMWISNTATTAMMFPIGLGIISCMAELISCQTGKKADLHRLRFGTGMMLIAAYASSVGGIGTPVGTPPNLIGLALIEKYTKIKIPFFQWMLFAIPLVMVMFVLLYFLMYVLHKPEVNRLEGCREYVKEELKKLGRWTPGQRNSLAAFLLAVVLWITPGFLALFAGTASPISKNYQARLPEAAAAVLAASFLFILPVDWKKREFTLSWRQAVKIDWGTLILFGGGITLGDLMFKTRLAEAVGRGLLNLVGAHSLWGITLAAIFLSIIITEFASNTAAATMFVPVILSLSLSAGINPLPPAIGAILGASCAFILPISTPPNAIVYGSGMVPITKMIRAGFFFDILAGFTIWLGLRLLLPLAGLV
jgi:sodium-dependent dicarboxylate transporter 2/3/5